MKIRLLKKWSYLKYIWYLTYRHKIPLLKRKYKYCVSQDIIYTRDLSRSEAFKYSNSLEENNCVIKNFGNGTYEIVRYKHVDSTK